MKKLSLKVIEPSTSIKKLNANELSKTRGGFCFLFIESCYDFTCMTQKKKCDQYAAY